MLYLALCSRIYSSYDKTGRSLETTVVIPSDVVPGSAQPPIALPRAESIPSDLVFSYPRDLKKLNKLIETTRFQAVSYIGIEIDSKVSAIDHLVTFLQDPRVSSRMASDSLTVSLRSHSGKELSPLRQDFQFIPLIGNSLLLEQAIYDFPSIEDLSSNIPFIDGDLRKFTITENGQEVTTIEIENSSIKIQGKCPSDFEFIQQINQRLPISEIDLTISKSSDICDITGIAAAQETLTKVRVAVNDGIILLNLEIAAYLPHLKSFALTSDKATFTFCPVKLPNSLQSSTLEYLELRAGQLHIDQPSLARIHINTHLESITIYADHERMDWVDVSPGVNKISRIYADDEELMFVIPEDKQKLLDSINSMKSIKRVNIVCRFSFQGESDDTEDFCYDLEKSAKFITDLYNKFYPMNFLRLKREPKYTDLTVTIIVYNTSIVNKKYPRFRFETLGYSVSTMDFSILAYFKKAKHPFFLQVKEDKIYRDNDRVWYKGSCDKEIPDISVFDVSSLQLITTGTGICDLSRLSLQKDTLKHLYIWPNAISSLSLNGLEYLETLEITGNSRATRISAPVAPFTGIKKLVLPATYSMETPFIISAIYCQDVTIQGANIIENTLQFVDYNSDYYSIERVTFLGKISRSVDIPVKNLRMDNIDDLKGYRNSRVEVFTWIVRESSVDLKKLLPVLKNLVEGRNFRYGEIEYTGNGNMKLKEPMTLEMEREWQIIGRGDRKNTFKVMRRQHQGTATSKNEQK
jgi:hypothetical protein